MTRHLIMGIATAIDFRDPFHFCILVLYQGFLYLIWAGFFPFGFLASYHHSYYSETPSF